MPTPPPAASAAPARRLLAALALACAAVPAGGAQAAPLQLADALAQALARHPGIAVQRSEIDAAAARLQQARGRFDWLSAAGVHHERTVRPLGDSALVPPDGLTQSRLIATGYQAEVSRLLAQGARVGAGLAATGNDNLAPGAARVQQKLLELRLDVTQPLLRGRGSAAGAAAAEEAARLELVASRYALRERAAQTIYSVLTAYWTYRARLELEQVAASSAQRSTALLASIQQLVDAGERPRADMVLLRADAADKEAALAAAALSRSEARDALGRLLGADAAAIAALAEPAEALPDPLQHTLPEALPAPRLAAWRSAARARRPDVQVLAWQREAALRQLAAARNAQLPQLDLQAGLGYAKVMEGGRHYGFLDQGGRVQSGPSVYARLNWEFPLQNNSARGAAAERAAQLAQLDIRQRDLDTAVATEIDGAARALQASQAQLRSAREGLAWYELAVSQEITKQKNGIATLIDVINVESRYVSARVTALQLQLACAEALARLRLATGTLLAGGPSAAAEPDRYSLDPAALAGLGPLALAPPPD
ncbi:TolC family protein [Massilia sp. Root418]|uniref:TolC family protein n=1 Tax=Massilia sp. Root418 TaxID=1736532 RepID=UPI00138F0688|nr:TolC family protein [Massilia sp. Root418]